MDPITATGAALALMSLGVLIGAAIGHWTAWRDAAEKITTERRAGFDAGLDTAWAALGPEARATYHATHAELISDEGAGR